MAPPRRSSGFPPNLAVRSVLLVSLSLGLTALATSSQPASRKEGGPRTGLLKGGCSFAPVASDRDQSTVVQSALGKPWDQATELNHSPPPPPVPVSPQLSEACCRMVSSSGMGRRCPRQQQQTAMAALAALFVALAAAAVRAEPTAYDQLEAHGFPRGLLPKTVLSYELQDNGKFVVHLDGSCSFTIPGEKIPVKYSDTIKGTLKYGSLRDLSGVQVKVLWIWWGITGISVSDDDLVFEVGFISAAYPASNFDSGLACDAKKISSPYSLRSAFM